MQEVQAKKKKAQKQTFTWVEQVLDRIFSKKEDLPNKAYYDKIDRAMAQKEARDGTATIDDAIHAMWLQGNALYSKTFGTKYERPFTTTPSQSPQYHEISHLCGRFDHTVPLENMLLSFEKGMLIGIGSVKMNAEETAEMNQLIQLGEDYHNMQYPRQYNDRSGFTSKMDKAVYMAAGMYLREKIDRFRALGLEQAPYEKQKAFCKSYSDQDHTPMVERNDGNWKHLDAPYALIKLSKREWSAITAVALNLAPPERTAYPERLKPVQEALQNMGLLRNMVPSFERSIENHAKNHPRGEAFDPEKFRRAREKRQERAEAPLQR